MKEIILKSAIAYKSKQIPRGSVVAIGLPKDGAPAVSQAQANRWIASGLAEEYTGQTIEPEKAKELGTEELRAELARTKAQAELAVANAMNRAKQAERARDDAENRLGHAKARIEDLERAATEPKTPTVPAPPADENPGDKSEDDTTVIKTTEPKKTSTKKSASASK
jgi:hypothetical protein